MATAAFNWSEYLRLATDLSRNPDEASHRSSISRAYYSVYHIASARAVANGYVDQKSHVSLWLLYQGNASRDCKKLATIGFRMKKERVDADYEIAATRIADRMNQQLIIANTFLMRLAALNATLPRPGCPHRAISDKQRWEPWHSWLRREHGICKLRPCLHSRKNNPLLQHHTLHHSLLQRFQIREDRFGIGARHPKIWHGRFGRSSGA